MVPEQGDQTARGQAAESSAAPAFELPAAFGAGAVESLAVGFGEQARPGDRPGRDIRRAAQEFGGFERFKGEVAAERASAGGGP
jgi:hypothetical protein